MPQECLIRLYFFGLESRMRLNVFGQLSFTYVATKSSIKLSAGRRWTRLIDFGEREGVTFNLPITKKQIVVEFDW
jgi:hypothetical protein